MITKQSIENLKSHIDIVDIISQSLELKKAGANFKACCPFHGEDTPSFVVSPVKQIYHCFGCDIGGDAIKFVQEYKKLSYPEALEDIANHLNVSLEYEQGQDFKDYTKIIESINSYYIKSLQDKELEYLLDRGITKESIETFEIGFAGNSQDQIQFHKNNFLNLEDSCDIGVLSKGNNGLYSRLIDRITFPIRNHTGKLIGFGGRTTVGHNAKYVNSIQTKLFDKSRNLYGLNIAKEHIYKKGTVVISEGYLDVVMFHQAGIKTAVATMGTALTKEHIPVIKKMNCKALLCYDGDKAGRTAAYKASILLSTHLIDAGVVIFDDGIDPADMVAEAREKELIQLMLNDTPAIAYAIDYIINNYDLSNPMDKKKALNECNNFLKELDPVIAEEYLQYTANKLNTNSAYLKLDQPQQQTHQPVAPQLSLVELNFIASALESFHALNLLHKYGKQIITHHTHELDLLLKGDSSLDYISLNDNIIIYNDEEFTNQLCIVLADHHTKELMQIQYATDIEPQQKISKIQEIKKKILDYKERRL